MKLIRFLAGPLLLATMAIALAEENPDSKSATSAIAATAAPSAQVIAYYFHGTIRCETCLKIEKQARQFIQRRFEADLTANRLVFKPLNYELKENSHFMQDYKLPCPSLVLVRQENGKGVQSKILGETWTLVNDSAAFDQYVEKEVGVFLNDSSKVTGGAVTPDAGAKEPVSDATLGIMVDSLADIEARFATNMNAAFVFVHGTNATSLINWAPINRAKRMMEADWDIKVGTFQLKPSRSDSEGLALRYPAFHPPILTTMLQNGSKTMISGELTETNLVQEFIYAVSSAGCCPFGEH